jgi:hypothetical protein
VINFRVGQRIRIIQPDNPCCGLTGVVTRLGLQRGWAYIKPEGSVPPTIPAREQFVGIYECEEIEEIAP